jgi:hypothetical protein
MKSFLLAVMFCGAGFTTYAQFSPAEADAESEAIITLLGIQKKEAVSKLVHVAKKDSAAFWKIYNEYLTESKANAKTRMGLYEKTAQSYSDMNAKTADSLATAFYKQRSEQETIIKDYYGKIKKAVDPVVAFQFYQAEVYLITQIRAQIMQQIPTYGELLNAKSK